VALRRDSARGRGLDLAAEPRDPAPAPPATRGLARDLGRAHGSALDRARGRDHGAAGPLALGPFDPRGDRRPRSTAAARATRDPAERDVTGRRAARLGLFALAVVGGVAGAGVACMRLTGQLLPDAHAYYDAASRLNH